MTLGQEKKKYFTQIPNFVFDHFTHWDRELYTQIKRMAGESGTYWKSQRTSSKLYGMSVNRLKKSLKVLLESNLIEKIGNRKVDTPGGPQNVAEYRIIDIWEMNIEFFKPKGVSQDDVPSDGRKERGVTNEVKGVSPNAHYKELYPRTNNEEKILSLEERRIRLREIGSVAFGSRYNSGH